MSTCQSDLAGQAQQPQSAEQADSRSNITQVQSAAAQIRSERLALEVRRALRCQNQKPVRPDAAELKQPDSSVKRNTALVKKLRLITEDARAALLEDIYRVNQSKYVSEAVVAVAEGSLKIKDVPAALEVCSALHQRYAEFGSGLAAELARTLCAAIKDDEPSSLLKRRGSLKLLAELLLCGVHDDTAALLTVVRAMATVDFRRDPERVPACLGLLASLAKGAGEELLGFPAKLPALPFEAEAEADGEANAALRQARAELAAEQAAYQAEAAHRFRLTPEQLQPFLRAMTRAFEQGCTALEAEHGELLASERRAAHTLNNRGEVPEGMAATYERQRALFEGLQRSLAQLGASLERSLPDLPESRVSRITSDEGGIMVLTGRDLSETAMGPFEDEETRAFYKSLPDLQVLVPGELLDDAAADTVSASAIESSTAASAATDGEAAGTAVAAAGGAAGGEGGGREARREADTLLARLPTCLSREACDQLAQELCLQATKGFRKRLVKTLCSVPWGQLQMLPYYARIAASLNQVFPDIGFALVKAQEEEFEFLQNKKDPTQRSLETRLGNIRYLAELAKFRLVPFGTLFTALKMLLDDFSAHNVDIAAALVETAGRFLYCSPETHTRMANMVEVMMKLKNARNIDARQSMLVDSAYFQCKPTARRALQRKQRPPVHEYIRHLVYDCMDEEDLKKVMRKLRRLPWAAYEAYLVHCLLGAVKGRVSHVPLVASLAAGLSRYHPSLGIAFVDALLEEVRVGLEAAEAGEYQRRVSHMRLLGEMYNYRLVDSKVVFDTLHLLLSFGHDTPEEAEMVDPAGNFFRVRLVCALLETCGQYFGKGSAARRLDRFLLYFQRYVLAKPMLPLDVEFDVQDLLEHLRPALQRFETFAEAVDAVAALEAEDAAVEAQGGWQGEDADSDSDVSSAGDGQRRRISEAEVEMEVEPAWGEEAEQAVRMLGPAKEVEVDDDFEREFSQLMLEHQGRPANAFQGLTQGEASPSGPPSAGAPPQESGGSMTFKVLTRRSGGGGGREERARAVQVPASSAIVQGMQSEAAAEAAERAEIKRLVLEADKREQLAAGLPQVLPLATFQRQVDQDVLAGGARGRPSGSRKQRQGSGIDAGLTGLTSRPPGSEARRSASKRRGHL
ncbi:hypothetical protein WJX72_000988 [[Myrmecia] bisecta]|uniref:MIF4G domain-containing protein n=1 Tax=[Myrmecia] bisecta TaxID=41462 RepID=A0AAW1PF16_9CHLO